MSSSAWNAAIERQVPMRIDGHTVYLDLYAPHEMVNVELDGRRGHTSPLDRDLISTATSP